jgi:tryptophan-rich sensory protein
MSDEEEDQNEIKTKKEIKLKEELDVEIEKKVNVKVKAPDYNYKNVFHRFAEYESRFQPPDRYFKYAWTFLYITYIISLITVRSSVGCTVSLSIGLGLNLLWIPAFLFFKSPLISFIIISLQLIWAVDSVFILNKKRKFVQLVFISMYLAWIIFAFYLNFVITKNYYLFNFPVLQNPDLQVK